MNNKDQENFSLGFAVGVLAGIAGYFLTRTQEGIEIKEKALKEWNLIRKKLEDEGVITGDEPNLTEIISVARTKLFEVIGEDISEKKKPTKKGRRRKVKTKLAENETRLPNSKKGMFKGI